ncbi:hypothetical protein AB6A40_006650 [Gnathostoma spinigerum]|uniref:Uncharacterized protein n=1 Tax=Gnathostoma spinigerum TaxID=75299 RepID=A0ABD6EJK9_9BILA
MMFSVLIPSGHKHVMLRVTIVAMSHLKGSPFVLLLGDTPLGIYPNCGSIADKVATYRIRTAVRGICGIHSCTLSAEEAYLGSVNLCRCGGFVCGKRCSNCNVPDDS